MNWLYVFIGGGVGSVLRYAIGLTTPMFIKTSFPMATFISNTLACLLLAMIVYSVQKEPKADWLNHLLIIITGIILNTFDMLDLSFFG